MWGRLLLDKMCDTVGQICNWWNVLVTILVLVCRCSLWWCDQFITKCLYLLLENEYSYDYCKGQQVCRHPHQAVLIWSLETHTQTCAKNQKMWILTLNIYHWVELYTKNIPSAKPFVFNGPFWITIEKIILILIGMEGLHCRHWQSKLSLNHSTGLGFTSTCCHAEFPYGGTDGETALVRCT